MLFMPELHTSGMQAQGADILYLVIVLAHEVRTTNLEPKSIQLNDRANTATQHPPPSPPQQPYTPHPPHRAH